MVIGAAVPFVISCFATDGTDCLLRNLLARPGHTISAVFVLRVSSHRTHISSLY